MPTVMVSLPRGSGKSLTKQMLEGYRVYGSPYVEINGTMHPIDEWGAIWNQQSTTRRSLDTLCDNAFKKTAWRYYLTRKDEYNTYPSATGHMFPWYHQNRKY